MPARPSCAEVQSRPLAALNSCWYSAFSNTIRDGFQSPFTIPSSSRAGSAAETANPAISTPTIPPTIAVVPAVRGRPALTLTPPRGVA
jgi:hypothetical protein